MCLALKRLDYRYAFFDDFLAKGTSKCLLLLPINYLRITIAPIMLNLLKTSQIRTDPFMRTWSLRLNPRCIILLNTPLIFRRSACLATYTSAFISFSLSFCTRLGALHWLIESFITSLLIITCCCTLLLRIAYFAAFYWCNILLLESTQRYFARSQNDLVQQPKKYPSAEFQQCATPVRFATFFRID